MSCGPRTLHWIRRRIVPAAITAIGALVLAVGSVAVSPGPASGELPLYRYIDADGLVHFTNVPSDGRFHRITLKHDGLRAAGRVHRWKQPSQRRYDRLITRAAAVYRLEPALVKAVIAAESNFEPRVVSHRGAQGLMQLMPTTARTLGVDDPLRPADNVLGGTRYLREMLDRYGDLPQALAAYNAGPSAVDRYQGVPPYRETQAYVARVLEYYRGYHRDFRR